MINHSVSIIIPTYNRADFIVETLDSVWHQTYRPIEVVIIDDGSTDGTNEVVKGWMSSHNNDQNFIYIYRQQQNQGAPAARNRGAGMARGDYLMFLDSDDLLSANGLENLVDALKNSKAEISACGWSFFVEEKSGWVEREGKPLGSANTDLLKRWLGGWYIPPCALLWKRAAYKKMGGWDESLLANQDGDLMLRYLVSGGGITFAGRGKSCYRKHAGRVTLSERRSQASIQSREKVLDKVVAGVSDSGQLVRYKKELAAAYYFLACEAYYHRFRTYGDQLYKKVKSMDLSFRTDNVIHRVLENFVGTYYKEQLHRLINYVLPGRSA